ncbi:MAG: hypothetical protein ACKVPY_01485 [Paracoccaceae bacterium]
MDNFSGLPSNLTAPARDGAAVTPSDTTDLAFTSRALYVGQAGNLTAILAGGQTVAFQAVPAGTLLPVRVTRVTATGTTAGAIVALW